MKKLFAALLILLSLPSWADEGVFINPMPKEDLQAIKQALVGRKWEILKQGESDISAKISAKGRNVSARLTIFYKDGGYYYKGEATRSKWVTSAGGTAPKRKQVSTEIPKQWIFNLIYDTKRYRRLNSKP